MAQFRHTFIQPELAAAIEAGNATESAVQTVRVLGDTSGDGIQRGALLGATIKCDTADTITIRFYNDSSKTIMLGEIDAVIAAVNTWKGAQFAQPIPFWAGLFWTAEAAGGTGRDVQVYPMLQAIAGTAG
jgi:hypothetical protein